MKEHNLTRFFYENSIRLFWITVMAAINGFTMAAGQAQIKAPIDSSELYTHAEKVMSFPVDGINGNVPRRRGANKFAAGY